MPVFILSLSVHEWAHAYSAHKLGDPTARMLGRLTLDPLSHISFIGTVVFPVVAIVTTAPFFGWAKPVPVDMRNFKNPRTGMAIVAFAGPLSNIVLAVGSAFLFGMTLRVVSVQANAQEVVDQGTMLRALLDMLRISIQVNIFLALFNMIPLPPLDGAKVLQAFVGERLATKIDEAAPFASILLLLIMFRGGFELIAAPGFWFYSFLQYIFVPSG